MPLAKILAALQYSSRVFCQTVSLPFTVADIPERVHLLELFERSAFHLRKDSRKPAVEVDEVILCGIEVER